MPTRMLSAMVPPLSFSNPNSAVSTFVRFWGVRMAGVPLHMPFESLQATFIKSFFVASDNRTHCLNSTNLHCDMNAVHNMIIIYSTLAATGEKSQRFPHAE